MTRFSLALCLGLSLFATPLRASDPLTLVLDWFVNPDHAPIILADKLGYFAEAGLAVEIIAPADPTEPPKLVAAGQADIAISYQPQLHLQVHEGLPLVRIGTLVATPLACLMVNDAGNITDISDLKGGKIGYSVSGVYELLAQKMLEDAGLQATDAELINVSFSLTPALMSGQVDAVIGAFRNFELTQMEIAGGKGRCFYPEENGIPAYDELIFVGHPDTLDRETAARFLAAVERGVHYMLNHPETAFEIFASAGPDLSDRLNAEAFKATLPRFSQSPAALDQGRYARFEAFLHAGGLVPKALPVGRLAVDLGAK